jgi:hypothetical protein
VLATVFTTYTVQKDKASILPLACKIFLHVWKNPNHNLFERKTNSLTQQRKWKIPTHIFCILDSQYYVCKSFEHRWCFIKLDINKKYSCPLQRQFMKFLGKESQHWPSPLHRFFYSPNLEDFHLTHFFAFFFTFWLEWLRSARASALSLIPRLHQKTHHNHQRGIENNFL